MPGRTTNHKGHKAHKEDPWFSFAVFVTVVVILSRNVTIYPQHSGQKSIVALTLKNRGCNTDVGVSQVYPPAAFGVKF